MTRRLSLTIFLAVLGSLAVFALAVAFAWWWNAQAREAAFEQRLTRELAVEILPAAAEGPEQLRRALERGHRRARMDLTVVDGLAGRPAAGRWPRQPRRCRRRL